MSTENTSPDAANAAVATPAKPVVPAAASHAEDPNKEPSELPAWVVKRLDQAKRSGAKESEANVRKAMLAELGIDDPESAKQLFADAKKRAEERKSLEQKAAERDLENTNLKKERDELRESAKSFATTQMEALTEAQRNAVKDLAGEDPAKQLKTIATLRPTWGTAPAGAASPTTTTQVDTTTAGSSNANQAPPAGKPAAATAPGATAPPANGGAPLIANHLEVYESLSNQGSSTFKPFAAGAYLLAHGKEIEAARKARGAN